MLLIASAGADGNTLAVAAFPMGPDATQECNVVEDAAIARLQPHPHRVPTRRQLSKSVGKHMPKWSHVRVGTSTGMPKHR
jgi:hypothetical protein